jgi:hypothetical protein
MVTTKDDMAAEMDSDMAKCGGIYLHHGPFGCHNSPSHACFWIYAPIGKNGRRKFLPTGGDGLQQYHGFRGDRLETVPNRGAGEIAVINEVRPGKMPTDLEPARQG